jgi:hypothetical protein
MLFLGYFPTSKILINENIGNCFDNSIYINRHSKIRPF